MPKLSQVLFGSKPKQKKLSTLTPEQQELMTLINEGLTSGEGAFGDIFGKFNQQEFEEGVTKPALKNFQEQILPMLQEKFIARGDVGGSGMQRAQGRAATDLQSNLANLMYQAQQTQKQNRIGGVNTSFGRQATENLHIPGTEGLVQGAAKAFAQGAGSALGGGMGGGGAGMGVGTPGGGISNANIGLLQQARGINGNYST